MLDTPTAYDLLDPSARASLASLAPELLHDRPEGATYLDLRGLSLKPLPAHPWYTVKDFSRCVAHLWKDRLGQISLAVTTLFWGAGATLQFIVIEWARATLNFDLSKAAILQGVTAVGIALGAVLASVWVALDRSVRVIPLGIAMGLVVIVMNFVTDVKIAVALMVLIGALAGFFVVPMNALLQHRGHHLVGAGRSIAVQNFNENISIFLMLGLYALMEKLELPLTLIIVVFGLLMAGIMGWLYKTHVHDQDTGKI